MDFRDEIIPYGGLNENTGLSITTNADRSVHAGVELTAAVKFSAPLNVSGNLAFNYNRIKDYVGTVEIYLPDWSSYRLHVDYKDKTIAGLPNYLGT